MQMHCGMVSEVWQATSPSCPASSKAILSRNCASSLLSSVGIFLPSSTGNREEEKKRGCIKCFITGRAASLMQSSHADSQTVLLHNTQLNLHLTKPPTLQSLLYFPLPLQNRPLSVFYGLPVQILPSQASFAPQLRRQEEVGVYSFERLAPSTGTETSMCLSITRHFLLARAIGKSPPSLHDVMNRALYSYMSASKRTQNQYLIDADEGTRHACSVQRCTL